MQRKQTWNGTILKTNRHLFKSGTKSKKLAYNTGYQKFEKNPPEAMKINTGASISLNLSIEME